MSKRATQHYWMMSAIVALIRNTDCYGRLRSWTFVSGRYETQLWFWWYSVLTEMFRTLFNLNLVHMTQLLNNASLDENASYCPQKRGNNSLGTLLGVRREQLSRAFRTFRCSFRRWSFDNTCGHRINAKFHQSLVEISNLLYQRVPKSWSTFVEKKINQPEY